MEDCNNNNKIPTRFLFFFFFFFQSFKTPLESFTSYPNRIICRFQDLKSDLKFVLHDTHDDSRFNTIHARDFREGYLAQIRRLSNVDRECSICINKGVNLTKAALYIAAEDDYLIFHSLKTLQVDSFIERLKDVTMEYCLSYPWTFKRPPEELILNLERYLFRSKFRRADFRKQTAPRALYLHSVLAHRSGSAVMLTLISSEVLKMLCLQRFLNFDVEIYFPSDSYSLPRAYQKQKSKDGDHLHIMTTQSLLVEILKNLKEAFWPFQCNHARSLFLSAANCINGRTTVEERAARSRLDRGHWTSVPYGDMRHALSACERLILLNVDCTELRDYSILLHHCGLYKESRKYLRRYQSLSNYCGQKHSNDIVSKMEKNAVDKLMVRLNLISMEEGWTSRPPYAESIYRIFSKPLE